MTPPPPHPPPTALWGVFLLSCTYCIGMNPWGTSSAAVLIAQRLQWKRLETWRDLCRRTRASMHPKAVTDRLVDLVELSVALRGHRAAWGPLVGLRENSALTPPLTSPPLCSPANLLSGQCAPFTAFLLPFWGYVMTICYRLIYSKTCLKSALFCLFYWTFLLLQFFLFTLYHFLVDYPCMIILKYNQTFGVLISFFSLYNPPCYYFIYFVCFFVFSCILSSTNTNEYAQ